VNSPFPQNGRGREPSPFPIALGILFVTLALRLLAAPWIERLELFGFDASLHLRAKLGFALPLDEKIVIVGVEPEDLENHLDEASAIAEGIRGMAALGARVIALDVIYRKISQSDQEKIASAIGAVEARGVRVIVPAMMDSVGGQLAVFRSLPLVKEGRGAAGIVNAEIHLDQMWRGYRMVWRVAGAGGETSMPSLALAAHIGYEGVAPPGTEAPGQMVWEVLDGNNRLVKDEADDTEFFLNFREEYGSTELDREHGISGRYWNLRGLLERSERGEGGGNGSGMDAALGGKIVFIGSVDQSDQKATAFGHQPGVMLHAQALSDFRQGLRIGRAGTAMDILMLCGVFGLALGSFRHVRTPGGLIGIAVVGFLALSATILILLWQWQWLVAGVSVLALWIVLNAGESIRRYLGERDSRRNAEAMMSLYFSPSVLEQVRKDPGSRKARMTEAVVVLSDLRNFSAISERCALEDVHDLLNRVFEIQCDAAMAEDGSLSNFAGDQFIAYWGAPRAQPDAADRAQRAVQEMIRRLEALRSDLKPEIRELFGYGFAMHRGRVLFGNKGSSRFLNYTIIGDTVNAVARMEALTKHYRVGLLASGEYCAGVTATAARRLIDRIVVKGKSRHLDLYQFADAGHDDSEWAPQKEFDAALSAYLRGEFGEARKAFAKLFKGMGDPVCAVLEARCVELMAQPRAHWEGAYPFQSK
jgi:class 3 adenylate cyclase/CHASE2 domain-containing sensor protein